MRVLLLGSGGREHALADALLRENTTVALVAAPGNPGIAELARVAPVAVGDPAAVVALAEAERTELVVVGPEAPLAAGVVNRLRQRGIPVFGPTMEAATVALTFAFVPIFRPPEKLMSSGLP